MTNQPTRTADVYQAGDVVEDSYGNPAVVLRTSDNNLPEIIMQTVGSDRGRRTGIMPLILRRITDPEQAEWAREVARAEWRRGNRWRAGRNKPC